MEPVFDGDGNSYDIFKFQRILLIMSAQWPLTTSKSSRTVKTCAGLYEAFMIVLPLHIAIFHMKSVYDHWGENINNLSDFITSSIIYSFCFFATVFFILNSNKMKNLVSFLNANFRLRSAKGMTYITIQEAYKKAKLYSYTWTACCLMGTVTWSLYPIAVHEKELPLRCWYPFDEKQPVVYEILYFIQFLGQLQLAIVFANGGAVYFVLIILICGQYDMLFCSLKNVVNTADLNDGGKVDKIRSLQTAFNQSDEEVSQYYCSIEKMESFPRDDSAEAKKKRAGGATNLKDALKDCVKHHHAILNVCREMENFYNPFCLIKSLQITFQMCFLLFIYVNLSTSSIMRTISLFQYIYLTCVELLLFTYFGEVLRIQSLRVGESLMRSPWFQCSLAIKKEILIILPNALRAVLLTSGKFYPMDIERLRLVATSAFSFFTLLQNMNAKNAL